MVARRPIDRSIDDERLLAGVAIRALRNVSRNEKAGRRGSSRSTAIAQRARAVIRIIDKYRCSSLRGSGLPFEPAAAGKPAAARPRLPETTRISRRSSRYPSTRAKAPPMIHRRSFHLHRRRHWSLVSRELTSRSARPDKCIPSTR